jgi:3-oxoacyl-[acyl-carrier protein] reductase
MNQSLTGKVALVTGASRGIGAACAVALAQAGAAVALNSRGQDQTEDAGAEAVAAEINAAGGRAITVFFDVSDSAAVGAGVNSVVEQMGRLDILVNNAGLRLDGLAMTMKDEQWRAALGVNLDGVFFCCREAIRHMRKTGGSIINVSSVAAFAGSAGQANYSAAKAGVLGLTRSLALEYGSRAIRVNAVVPGIIETAMTGDVKPELREAWLKQIPLGRLGQPQDIAQAVLFLAGETASYITGATLHVNGGGYPA